MVAMIRMIATTIRSSKSEKPFVFFIYGSEKTTRRSETAATTTVYWTGCPDAVPGKHGEQVVPEAVA